MDDATYLYVLREDPDNEEARTSYLNWLEQSGDKRAEYLRLLLERRQAQEVLDGIDRRLGAHWPRVDNGWLDAVAPLRIRSPVVGRVYLKPRPDSRPYVVPGDWIGPDTVVCMVEAMMLFYEITAGVRGVVAAVLVGNCEPVEYNQVLFKVDHLPRPIAGG
jgi:uncharacterized protein (TIGR02996 family)